MLDEILIGLILGYERMTGDSLGVNETVARLNRDGMNIRVYNTSSDTEYQFQRNF